MKRDALPAVLALQHGLYLNREISLLDFNKRVLAQAENSALPLLERLRYLCIVSSNLDEFFEIRLASQLAPNHIANQLLPQSVTDTLVIASIECHDIVRKQYALLNEDILPQLARHHIYLAQHDDLDNAQMDWLKQYFDHKVRPLLNPIGLDPSHPFPQVVNKSLNFIVELSGKDAFGRSTGIAIVKVPRGLPRVIQLPDELSKKGMTCCLLSSVIGAYIGDLFASREVISYSQFRVTRNSDLWVDEEEVNNLRQALKHELSNRPFGFAVRLEVASNCAPHLSQFLLNQFSIDESRMYAVDGPVNMVRLHELINLIKQPDLFFPIFTPDLSVPVGDGTIFEQIRKQDILLHHPYQSFQPVIDFITTAAHDPHVVAIKQTIYRAGVNSELVEALITAAMRGKEVIVIDELKARFDEQANITWAERLESVGAQVVYGVVGLKTHAKMALVIRREDEELRYYAHLGTGNYNPVTTRFYTDFGLLTANSVLTSEVNEVFTHLTALNKPKKLTNLWLAPFALHKALIAAIRREANIAKAGRPGRIIAKMNSLTDESVIDELYKASSQGVKIDLIIRGACSLRPGVPGLSENIHVRSIVGRFLEHSRIYYFRNDLDHTTYLSSADWMNRNLFRRIEVAFPVLDPALKKRVMQEGLMPYLKDNTNAWELKNDGQYYPRKPKGKQLAYSAQKTLAWELGA